MAAMSVRCRLACWCLLIAVGSASASTITVTNFDGPDSHLLTRDDGSLFFNGLVWVGTFDIDNSAIQNAVGSGQLRKIENGFRQFGRSVSVNFNGLPALYQDVVTQTVTAGDEFAGRSVYTVISDQGLIHDAGEILIFEHDQVFQVDPLRNDPALLDEDSGELLVGEFDRFRRSLDQIQDQPAFTLARVIPEPSSVALLILGLVSLLSRRQERS